MRPARARGRWLQLNVALARPKGQALPSARALFGHLAPLVARYRREKRLRWFLFVRKPPDVRLRFLGPDPGAELAPTLSRRLDALCRAGHVQRFFPSVYEPETRRFGGPEAMAHVHAYSDADTTGWIAFERLAERGKRTIATETLNVAVLNDLFVRTLGDGAEIWDAWSNLLELLGAGEPAPAGPVVPVELLDGLLGRVSRDEVPIIRRYATANERLAAGLLRLWGRGRLRCGLRAILPVVALFHFNRHGVDGGRQAPLAGHMVAAWAPARQLVGAEVSPRPTRWLVAHSGPRPA